MNSIQILGTITRDIELRYTQSGTAIASFSIAYNEKRKQQDGSYNDIAHFFDVTAFGKSAENINGYFHKGSRILIQGSLDYQNWTDQQGQKRSKVGIKLERFDFIDRKADAQSNNTQTNQQGYQQPQQGQQQQYQQQQGYQTNQQPQMQYEQQQQDGSYRPTPPPNQPPAIDVDEDEIPF